MVFVLIKSSVFIVVFVMVEYNKIIISNKQSLYLLLTVQSNELKKFYNVYVENLATSL